jgi:hypothetical protein
LSQVVGCEYTSTTQNALDATTATQSARKRTAGTRASSE